MKKYFLRIVSYVILAAVIAVLFVLYTGSLKQNKILRAHDAEKSVIIKDQQATIDSLLKFKTYVFDVKLNVTDKSKNNVDGRYNKGTIEMPSVKTYTLDLEGAEIFTQKK
jgi:hypothetical protein